jgi:carbon monoxide dehydrogenase subunit G
MELEHSFSVPVPEDRAWDVLLDVEKVAPCMPGATLQSVEGDEIRASIKVKVGPITMVYQGTAHFTERDPAAHVVTLEASGKETRGAGTASAKVRSTLAGNGDHTDVTVHTSLNVTGKPAQFGRGVLNEVGGRLIGIFADNLAAMLAAESGSGSADGAEEETPEVSGGSAEPGAVGAEESLPIDVLNLPVRAWNSLHKEGIQTLGDLTRRTPEQLLAIGNIGPASLAEITTRLADRGLVLAEGEGDAAAAQSAAASGQADEATGQPGAESGQPDAAAGAGTEPAAAVPAARPGPDDALSAPATPAAPVGRHAAAEKAGANGGTTWAPRQPAAWQAPQDDAIDLLGVAGLPVLKRALPAAAALLALILVVLGVRRRRSRR